MTTVGLITVGQSPRSVVEAGALDGLDRDRVAALALERDDEIGNAGLAVMDCIGFRRKTRDEMAALTGAPTLVANLLVARVAAELLGR